MKYGFFRDVVDLFEFDAVRRSLLRDESPKTALTVYALLFNKLLVLFGLVLPPDVLVATLTPLSTVLFGCSIAFALGRLTSASQNLTGNTKILF